MGRTTIRTSVSVFSLLYGVALGVAGAQVAPPSTQTPPDTVLVTYADGSRSSIRIGLSGCGMWTSNFPRMAPWTPPPDQLPVAALKFACERASDGIRVAVSVLRGSPHQREDSIATVLVTSAQPVLIEQLRGVGVNALTLSLGSVTPTEVPTPTVATVSPLLDVAAVTVTATTPRRYLVLLRNRGPKAARTLVVRAYRGGRLAIGSQPRGRDGTAIIEAGGEYILNVNVPTSRPAPDGSVALNPLDDIRVTGVVWGDGSHDGAEAVDALIADFGNRLQLIRVAVELQRARSAGSTPAALRTVLTDLSTDVTDALIDDARASIPATAAPTFPRDRVLSLLRTGLSSIKLYVADELKAFESAPPGAGSFQAWLDTNTERYLKWIERLGAQYRR